MSQNKKTQEQLFNRILINIAIAIVAYIVLYIFYAKFYLSPAIPTAIAFIVIAIALYIVSLTKLIKKNLKNYAHMFLAFAICLLYTRLSLIAGSILGLEKFIELSNSSALFKSLMNSRYAVIVISWLGALYLVLMLIYNTILINKSDKKNR